MFSANTLKKNKKKMRERERERDLDSMLTLLILEKRDMFILHSNLFSRATIVLINLLVFFLMNGRGERSLFRL